MHFSSFPIVLVKSAKFHEGEMGEMRTFAGSSQGNGSLAGRAAGRMDFDFSFSFSFFHFI